MVLDCGAFRLHGSGLDGLGGNSEGLGGFRVCSLGALFFDYPDDVTI